MSIESDPVDFSAAKGVFKALEPKPIPVKDIKTPSIPLKKLGLGTAVFKPMAQPYKETPLSIQTVGKLPESIFVSNGASKGRKGIKVVEGNEIPTMTLKHNVITPEEHIANSPYAREATLAEVIKKLREELQIWQARCERAESMLAIKLQKEEVQRDYLCGRCGGDELSQIKAESSNMVMFWKHTCERTEVEMLELKRKTAAREAELQAEIQRLVSERAWNQMKDADFVRIDRVQFSGLLEALKIRTERSQQKIDASEVDRNFWRAKAGDLDEQNMALKKELSALYADFFAYKDLVRAAGGNPPATLERTGVAGPTESVSTTYHSPVRHMETHHAPSHAASTKPHAHNHAASPSASVNAHWSVWNERRAALEKEIAVGIEAKRYGAAEALFATQEQQARWREDRAAEKVVGWADDDEEEEEKDGGKINNSAPNAQNLTPMQEINQLVQAFMVTSSVPSAGPSSPLRTHKSIPNSALHPTPPQSPARTLALDATQSILSAAAAAASASKFNTLSSQSLVSHAADVRSQTGGYSSKSLEVTSCGVPAALPVTLKVGSPNRKVLQQQQREILMQQEIAHQQAIQREREEEERRQKEQSMLEAWEREKRDMAIAAAATLNAKEDFIRQVLPSSAPARPSPGGHPSGPVMIVVPPAPTAKLETSPLPTLEDTDNAHYYKQVANIYATLSAATSALPSGNQEPTPVFDANAVPVASPSRSAPRAASKSSNPYVKDSFLDREREETRVMLGQVSSMTSSMYIMQHEKNGFDSASNSSTYNLLGRDTTENVSHVTSPSHRGHVKAEASPTSSMYGGAGGRTPSLANSASKSPASKLPAMSMQDELMSLWKKKDLLPKPEPEEPTEGESAPVGEVSAGAGDSGAATAAEPAAATTTTEDAGKSP